MWPTMRTTIRSTTPPSAFPIAFEKAIIYGAEAKLEVPDWHRFSGFPELFLSVGNAWYPGDRRLIPRRRCAGNTDQRPFSGFAGPAQHRPRPPSLSGQAALLDRGRQFNMTPALPFEFECDPSEILSQCIADEVQTYGQAVVNRINFARGRIYPAFQVNASAGADVYKSDRMNMRFQIDGQNLNNVLNVIDFGGLFSGNAIGPSRSVSMRLTTNF